MVYFGNAYDNLDMYSVGSQTEILFSLCVLKSKTGNFFVHFISNLQTFINSLRELQVSTDPRFCNYPTHSVVIVVAGIAVISVTDALSDAFAVFMADETERNSEKSKWEEAISVLVAKFSVGVLFALPFFFLELNQAITTSVTVGLILILILTYFIAKTEHRSVLKIMLGHLAVAILVIVVSGFVGQWAESLKESPRF